MFWLNAVNAPEDHHFGRPDLSTFNPYDTGKGLLAIIAKDEFLTYDSLLINFEGSGPPRGVKIIISYVRNKNPHKLNPSL